MLFFSPFSICMSAVFLFLSSLSRQFMALFLKECLRVAVFATNYKTVHDHPFIVYVHFSFFCFAYL